MHAGGVGGGGPGEAGGVIRAGQEWGRRRFTHWGRTGPRPEKPRPALQSFTAPTRLGVYRVLGAKPFHQASLLTCSL